MAIFDLESRSNTVGKVLNEKMVCQYVNKITCKGIWFGYSPFDYTSTTMMAQLVIIFLVSRICYQLLRPLRQTMVIAQLVGGIIIGPTFLSASVVYSQKLFPPGCKLVLDTFAGFGMMIHLFLLGVQIDMSVLKRPGKKAVVIGLVGLAFPLLLGTAAHKIASHIIPLEGKLGIGLPYIVSMNALTSFPVITSLLNELNILNTDLGRLSSTACLVAEVAGWFLGTIVKNVGMAIHFSTKRPIFSILTVIVYYSILLFVVRPLVIWMVRNTPEGKSIKESHFIAVLALVLVAGIGAELVGQHATFGAFALGVFLPDGPPLGTSLEQKLNTIATGMLLPMYCAMTGLRTDLFTLKDGRTTLIAESIIILSYIGKFTGTLLSSLFFQIPFWDAFALALIMCCKGIVDIGVYCLWLDIQLINRHLYTILVVNMVIVTMIATPFACYLYDPTKRYMAYQGKTILDSKQDPDLRILVCIYNEDNAPPMINLVEASNPARGSPISLYVLQLMELAGRASAVFVPQKKLSNMCTSDQMTRSERIVNAFKYFDRHNQGSVTVQHFTAIAPYASMHNDICNLTLERKISIILLPFHKKWAIDGTVEDSFPFVRAVNETVMKKSLCSVAVLVDRSQIGGNQPVLACQSTYRIAMIYICGDDDKEALAYSRHMAEHPNVSVTVIWFKQQDHDGLSSNDPDDIECIKEFRANAVTSKRVAYKEEIVKDGLRTTEVIRSMEDNFDLVIVGKNHDPDCPATFGLTEWSECPELGSIGDMLASSDFPFSVLIVQQPLVAGRTHSQRKNSSLKIHHHNFLEDECDSTPMKEK